MPPLPLRESAQRLALLVCVVAAGLPLRPASADPLAASSIVRDGTIGGPGQPVGVPDGDGQRFEIGQSFGQAAGANLFHSFTRLDVAAADRVDFTSDPGASFRNVITRVTGGRTQIDGTLISSVPGANFFLINPQGVLFGPNARIDVPAAFTISSADRVDFADGLSLGMEATTPTALSVADPVAYGFFGNGVASLEVQGALEVGEGQALSWIGGDVLVDGSQATDGGVLSSLAGDLTLLSVDSAGRVVFDPARDAAPVLEGFSALGSIRVVDDAVLSSAGISPLLGQLDRSGDPESQLIDVIERVDPSGPLPEDEILLSDSLLPNGARFVVSYRVKDDSPPTRRGAGRIRIRADDLLIRDADIRAETVGSDADSIEIDLDGDLEIRKSARPADAGILATTGRVAQGLLVKGIPSEPGAGCAGAVVACRVIESVPDGFGGSADIVELGPLDVPLVTGMGRGSSIAIRANDVRLIDGGRISTTSLSGGAPGAIAINARGDVVLSGRDAFAPDAPNVIASSAIASNHQGRPADAAGQEGGRIEIRARTLSVSDGGGVFAQTTGDGDAGDIAIDVADLVVLDDSQIDSSTSGQSLGPDPGGATTRGEGGTIAVRASRSVLLAGRGGDDEFARLSTFSQRASRGGAGSIEVTSPEIVITDGAGIAVTTEGEGSGGDIRLSAGQLSMAGGALLSASSESTTAPAGDIRVETTGSVRLDSGSSIAANTGIATGGNVRIRSGGTMLALADTAIRADAAILGGTGGQVVIEAPLLLRAASNEITADAPGGPEFQGTVEIRSPVIDLEAATRPPTPAFLDATALLGDRCAARRSGDRSGSFHASRYRRYPASEDGSLLAFGALDSVEQPPESATPGEGVTQLASRGPDPSGWRSPLGSGNSALHEGRFAEAEAHFGDALQRAQAVPGDDEAEATPARIARIDALRGLGRARQRVGNLEGAAAALQRATGLAADTGVPRLESIALAELGAALLAMGDLEGARVRLSRALEQARLSGDGQATALVLNQVGTLHAHVGERQEAVGRYLEAAERARSEQAALLEAQSLANAARAGLGAAAIADTVAALERAARLASSAARSLDAVALRIHLASTHAALAKRVPGRARHHLRAAHGILLAASAEAGALELPALRSRVYGALASLYEQEGDRDEEALYLTRQAESAAERAQSAELLARWTHQRGRIARERGASAEALAAFRKSVALLEQVDPASHPGSPALGQSFRRSHAPVYLALVDALVSEAEAEAEASQALLVEARNTVEQLRTAELRDYFRDECVAALAAASRPVESVADGAAVVYPIVMADRIELLVSTRAGIERYRVAIGRDALEDTVKAFLDGLVNRTGYGYVGPGGKLFDWLVAPYLHTLESADIDTLVVVPGSTLRTIPFSALYDGRHFLVERLAVAVAPSLRLLAPRRLEPEGARILLAGVTESVQGMPALAHVASEIEAIRAQLGGRVMLDDGFRAARLERELRERPPAIVHIASHAEFTDQPSTSYVLAHDRRLPLEELSGWIEANRFGNEPLELLVLSACETAVGNERAALGLAGLAIRSGARSALGSLWAVHDEATSRLIVSFYEELGRSAGTKAQALARAQQRLIGDRRFDHPFYWAGFMVINNWL